MTESNIRSIRLDYNDLEALDFEIFQTFTNLTRFEADSNMLKKITPAAEDFQFISLTYLSLG